MNHRPYSRSALTAEGPRPESNFLFFYSHDGEKRVLSNFWPCPEPFVDSANRRFPTSEHFMMHGKALLFNDPQTAAKILEAPTPLAAKMLGRKVQNFDERVWKENCVSIVAEGCFLKFLQCEEAGRFLLATGERILVEAAPRDRIWGIGMSASNENRLDPSKWRGSNQLGEALMTVRDRLREHHKNEGNNL